MSSFFICKSNCTTFTQRNHIVNSLDMPYIICNAFDLTPATVYIYLHTHFCSLNLCSQFLYLFYNNPPPPPFYLSSSRYSLISGLVSCHGNTRNGYLIFSNRFFPGHMAISLVSAGEDATFLLHSSFVVRETR